MIGHVIAAYCRGRRDAQAGERRRRQYGETEQAREIYLLGHRDELERMTREGRLPQMRLELELEPRGAE